MPETGDVELAKNKKEELTIKLESMGYDVGYRFAERCVLCVIAAMDVSVPSANKLTLVIAISCAALQRTDRACSSRST